MASTCVPDAWGWISSLPSATKWNTDTKSLCICSSTPTQPSLNLSIMRSLQGQTLSVIFSITAEFHPPIFLWTSNAFHQQSKSMQQFFNEETIRQLFSDIIHGVLKYAPNKTYSLRLPSMEVNQKFRDIFNLAIYTLIFLICIYEAPTELRSRCIDTLLLELTSSECRETSKLLSRILGSNLEEQWMKSVNLALTNRIEELHALDLSFDLPSPLLSYEISAKGLWKVQVYCPSIAMRVQDQSTKSQDDRLLFSLKYQQLEGVFQFTNKIIFLDEWIDVMVRVDNIRCDVNPLVSETLMTRKGYGSEEKHFPSRISLQLTPTLQTGIDVLSVSVSKSSDNPMSEVGCEKALEGAWDVPTSLGLRVSATETITRSMKPWKFEQSVAGNSAMLHWLLHDGINGREVFSSKPSRCALFNPRAWFRNRYASAYRPFTRQGGVIFAGDEYGESVWWKVSGGAVGRCMEWELRGRIWLTYWPNKHTTLHSETRVLEFKELLQLPLDRMQ